MDRTFRGFARPNPELPNDSLAMELAIYAGGSFVYSVRRSQGSDFGMEVMRGDVVHSSQSPCELSLQVKTTMWQTNGWNAREDGESNEPFTLQAQVVDESTIDVTYDGNVNRLCDERSRL